MEEYERQPDYRLRRATLGLIVFVIELAEIPLYADAFGNEIVALLMVRMVLTMVVGAFFVQGASELARVLLGAIRVLACIVGVVMAVDAQVWPLLGLSLADGAAATALFLMRFVPTPREKESPGPEENPEPD